MSKLVGKKYEYDKFQRIWNKIRSNPEYSECCEYRVSEYKVFERKEKKYQYVVFSRELRHVYLKAILFHYLIILVELLCILLKVS